MSSHNRGSMNKPNDIVDVPSCAPLPQFLEETRLRLVASSVERLYNHIPTGPASPVMSTAHALSLALQVAEETDFILNLAAFE